MNERRGRITGRLLAVDVEREAYASIVDHAEAAVVTVGLDGRVLTWNRAAEPLFGRTRAEALGEPFEAFDLPLPRGGLPMAFETRIGGTDVTCRVSELVGTDGDPLGHAIVARDVTEDRRGAALLERAVADRTRRLQSAVEAREAAELETVERLSRAVEFRDADTGEHVSRIGALAGALAQRAGLRPRRRHLLRTASVLHDVGKVAIPDAVLLKPGRLTPEERALVETHAQIGHDLLKGSRSRLLQMAAEIALTHHERWDGTGYPRGLAGDDIPLEGRIVAIVDVYDALTRDRVYRRACGEDEARAIMAQERGRHFDADLLDLFFAMG